ncbi:unnamed protein product [Somion occarium]|uniref:Uncharacterized protein n=1 Tax=Somion occarium TaxID=3059160 RepID=A0ABP1DKQ0_9APHY
MNAQIPQDAQGIHLPLKSIYSAFELLKDDVQIALQTQLGAACHLEERICTCLRFWEQTLQHSQLIPPANMDVICSSIHDMLTQLQAAKLQSSDTADMDAPEPAKLVYTGCPGCP